MGDMAREPFHDTQPDVGIPLAHCPQQRDGDHRRRGGRKADADVSREPAGLCNVRRRFHLPKNKLGLAIEIQPRIGRHYAGGEALEQASGELAFEGADLLA